MIDSEDIIGRILSDRRGIVIAISSTDGELIREKVYIPSHVARSGGLRFLMRERDALLHEERQKREGLS